jgi:tRNA-intron endonuclease
MRGQRAVIPVDVRCGKYRVFLSLSPSYKRVSPNTSAVKATLEGRWAHLPPEGRILHEQSGYGRPEKGGFRLSPAEVLYLVHREKLEVEGFDFESLLLLFVHEENFLRKYLVYRDIRERGYVVRTGPHDFRVFRRGQKPGTGESLYLVRVLSERNLIRFDMLVQEVSAARNMRKQYILAVVDDEDELTYYEIKLQAIPISDTAAIRGLTDATVCGRSILVHASRKSELEGAGFGTRLDDVRLLISPVEAAYLMGKKAMQLNQNGTAITMDRFLSGSMAVDQELAEKIAVFTDLRDRGFIPRTGYKFGHHFRVYSGQKIHSEMLVHAVARDAALPMSTISRSVRMAHSVKKKMFFGCVHNQGIQYIEFARIKL